MAIQPGRIAHTGIIARDAVHLAEFYISGLGFHQVRADMGSHRPDSSGTLRVAQVHMRVISLSLGEEGSHILEFTQFLDPVGPDQHQVRNGIGSAHLAIYVENVPDSFEALRRLGATVAREPVVGPTGRSFGFLRDPEGNWLELMQLPAASD